MAITRVHVGVGGAVALVVALAATALTKPWEGRRYTPYHDINGVLTVCDGNTHGVQQREYSDAECDAILHQNLEIANADVHRCVKRPMPPQVEAAFTDFAYNEGYGAKGIKDGFCILKSGRHSSVSVYANAGEWAKACNSFMAWDRNSRGLQNRHAAQRKLCLQALEGSTP